MLSNAIRQYAQAGEFGWCHAVEHLAQGLLAQIVLVGFLFLVAHILPYSQRVDNYLAMFSLVGELDM